MDILDFRNNTIDQIEKLFLNYEFNKTKLNNFKKQFRIQNIDSIAEIKCVKKINEIGNNIPFNSLILVKSKKDKNNNEKFLFKTYDGHFIESVLMPDKKNKSICISTQAGCKFNCLICNTGKIKFKRNLFTHEILDQIRQIYIKRIYPDRLSCVSFMGMGEPFDNLDNCMSACEWLSSDWGYVISYKKITFSTSGCIDFKNFFKYDKLPNLAVSLHTADENKRKQLMPCSKITLKKLKENMKLYIKKFKKHISIEYCLIKNFNDKKEDALLLIDYLKDLQCKINLLNYNKTKFNNFKKVSLKKLYEFKNIIKQNNIPVIYRKSLGSGINAGCGQLGIN